MTPIEMIIAERERQVSAEGYTTEHDDSHASNELAQAAACYVMPYRERQRPITSLMNVRQYVWPWGSGWKPTPDDRIRELVKAGALIVAEIERLQRKEAK
jgi:hypothetical protein